MPYFIFTVLLFLTACHSPMDHRVLEANKTLSEQKMQATFKNYDLSIQYQWIEGPFSDFNKNNTLFVVVKDKKNELTDLPRGLSLSFYAHMPSMGHPLDNAGHFEKISKGIYINQSIRYNMGGKWQNELWLVDEDLNVKDKIVWANSL